MKLQFEWDVAKDRENRLKHGGVTFELAKRAFKDPFAIELVDDREDYDEERLILIAMIDGDIYVVVHTERGEGRIRIISARKAEKHEADFYFRENDR